jgi:hypothetical protein
VSHIHVVDCDTRAVPFVLSDSLHPAIRLLCLLLLRCSLRMQMRRLRTWFPDSCEQAEFLAVFSRSYEINADNQLRFTSSCAFDLGGSACAILTHCGLHAWLWCSIASTTVARRLWGTHCGICACIAPRIDGRRMRRHWTLRSPCGGVIGVTRRPPQLVGIHTSASNRQTCL